MVSQNPFPTEMRQYTAGFDLFWLRRSFFPRTIDLNLSLMIRNDSLSDYKAAIFSPAEIPPNPFLPK